MDSNCKLSNKKCVPCNKDIPPLKGRKLIELHQQLGNRWQVIEEHHLEKEYLFPDFCKALAFTNKVGAVAEQEGHHPDIHLAYGKVKIQLWTHKINGLSESDFVMAAKCDEIMDASSCQITGSPPPLNAFVRSPQKGSHEINFSFQFLVLVIDIENIDFKVHTIPFMQSPLEAQKAKFHLGIYAVIEKEHRILLVKKIRGPYRGMWDLPGGRPLHGETIPQTLEREVREETGIEVIDLVLLTNQTFVVEYKDEKESISLHHTCLIYQATKFDSSNFQETINQEDVAGCAWIEKTQISHLPLSNVVKSLSKAFWDVGN